MSSDPNAVWKCNDCGTLTAIYLAAGVASTRLIVCAVCSTMLIITGAA